MIVRIICFGELMLRLKSPSFERFLQSPQFEATFGGGEANTAVSLANFHLDSAFVTKLPDNAIGQAAVNSLKYFGVDTSDIARGGKRVGIYYLERGASQRASKVIYDRSYSAITMADKNDFDWDKIFESASWFHFTGITPALGTNVAEICLEACKKAKEKGLRISCDLNYRKHLWTPDEAKKAMTEVMPYVDVCIANEEDAENVLGIKAEATDVVSGKINSEGYKVVAKRICDQFGCKYTAVTLRVSLSASDNNWSAMLYSAVEDKYFFSKEYGIHIVDRVGGGDSFGAGLIYGLITGMSSRDSLEFAIAASCLKHSVEGDFNRVSIDEVKTLMNGNGSGRVQR